MARAKALKPKKPKIPGLGMGPRLPGERPRVGERTGVQLPSITRAKPNKPGKPTGGDPKEGFIPPGRGATVKGGKVVAPKDQAPKGKGKGPGKSGKGRGGKGGTTKTLTAQQRAEQEMQGIYGPVLGEYARLIQSRQAEAAAEAARKQAVYAAFAKYYQEHAPQQIQGIYSQAAAEQSSWGKGYSLGMQLAQQEQAKSSNSILDVVGAPEGQNITPGPEAGNVIYGLGGGIPANTLSQQGAAFSAAAALQSPAIFAEGGRQANELLKLSSQEIEKLRFEELQVRTEMRSKVFELASAYREAGQKAKADRLEAMQDQAEYLTKTKGTVHLVVNGRIKDTKKWSIDVLLKIKSFDLKANQQAFSQDLALDKYDLDKKKYELSVWKAEHPNLKVVGNATVGYYAMNPLTGEMTGKPILAGTGRAIQIFGSKEGGYFGFDPNTRTVFKLKGGTGKSKAASQKTINDGWKLVKSAGGSYTVKDLKNPNATDSQIAAIEDAAGIQWTVPTNPDDYDPPYQAGFYASQASPDVPLSSSELNTMLSDAEKPKKPYAIFQSLLEMGIGGRRAFLMVKKYFPQFATKFKMKIPLANVDVTIDPFALGGKVDAAYSGGATTAQLAALWIQAGGDPQVAQTAGAIAMAESGGRIDAWNPVGKDKSAGLWQINYHGKLRAPRTRQFGPPELLRRDPLANAKAAVAIYKSAGNSFSPWSTYNEGTYKEHLDLSGSGPQNVAYTGGTGGAWGGSLKLADQGKAIAAKFGLSATGKRSRKNTSSGGISDHWTGSKNAFAYDLSGSRTQMHNAARALAQALGIDWDGLSELIEDVYRGPFRIQIIYNTEKYGGHMDHIHFGVRRVSYGSSV